MATTRDIGPYYWHILKYPYRPNELLERADTQEIDEPFRVGVGWSIRVPLTKWAIVVGKWGGTRPEGEALTYAIRGRIVPLDELDWESIRGGASVQDSETTVEVQDSTQG